MKRAPVVTATGTITDGVLKLDDRGAAADDLKMVPNGGIVLTVAPSGGAGLRHAKLQRYYRGVVLRELAGATQQTPEVVHAVLAARFLGQAVSFVSEITGEQFDGVVVPSTVDLESEAFWDYITACRDLARSAYGLSIPDPDPAWRLHRSVAA
jgi:hypothetical protein